VAALAAAPIESGPTHPSDARPRSQGTSRIRKRAQRRRRRRARFCVAPGSPSIARPPPPQPPTDSAASTDNGPPFSPTNGPRPTNEPKTHTTTGGELAHPSEIYDRAHLRRWLVAREWDVGAARRSLVEHASWRAYQVPGGRVPEARVAAPLSEGKVLLQGVDKAGRALMIVRARLHRPIPAAAAANPPPPPSPAALLADPTLPLDPLRAQRAFVTYVLDACLAACDPVSNPGRRIVSLFDLTGATLQNMDVACMRHVIGTLNAHSVERMAAMYFYNPPSVFWGLWRALSPLLPEATRAKIVLVDGKRRGELVEAIGRAALPSEYGGDAEPLPIQEAVARFGLPPALGTLGEAVARAAAAAAAAREEGGGGKGAGAARRGGECVDVAVEAAAGAAAAPGGGAQAEAVAVVA